MDLTWGLFCLWCLKDIQGEMRKETTGRENQRFEVLLLKILSKCLVSDTLQEYSNSISLSITSRILESSPCTQLNIFSK